jgi:hypothetical protein
VFGEEDSQLCFCFFMLWKKRSGNMYGIYAMAASGRMQYDYKQTNAQILRIKVDLTHNILVFQILSIK